MIEQTLSIVKPDAVERNLENKIKSFFKEKNLKILKSKKVHITKEEAAEFYKVHQTKPFYQQLCNYLSSGPIVVMILEGENAISPFLNILRMPIRVLPKRTLPSSDLWVTIVPFLILGWVLKATSMPSTRKWRKTSLCLVIASARFSEFFCKEADHGSVMDWRYDHGPIPLQAAGQS